MEAKSWVLPAFTHRFAARFGDTEEQSFQKLLILIIALSCCACGLVWSGLYYTIFGAGLTTMLPLTFVAVVGAAIVIAARRADHMPLVYAQLTCITWISALIGWSIGSLHNSGLVIAWSFLGPIGALIFLPYREAVFWLLQFLLVLAVTVLLNPALLGEPLPVSDAARALFYLMNIGTALSVVFFAAAWFTSRIRFEQARSDELIDNMLPARIAQQLKEGVPTIADAHKEVSVLFADICGFTNYSAQVSAEQLVHDPTWSFAALTRSRWSLASRRSRPSATRTWSRQACRTPATTTRRPSQISRSRSETQCSSICGLMDNPSRSAWAFIQAPRWQGSSVPRASPTTCGATR